MSKALIIQGADFSANKIATVSFIDPVPCTGLALTQESISMTKVGSISTIIAVVTPLNTTDSVTWVSDNPDIIDVRGGNVIQKGVGHATITATCGTYSATCTVTAIHVIDTQTDAFAIKNTAAIPGDKDYLRYVQPDTTTYGYIQYHNKVAKGYPSINNQSALSNGLKGLGTFAIPIGATKVSVTNPDATRFGQLNIQFMNDSQLCTQATVNDSAKYITTDVSTQMLGVAERDTVLSELTFTGYNSLIVTVYDRNKQQVVEDYNCVITFT